MFIAWIWIDYYRLIDLYERDSLKHFLTAFIFGWASVPIVFLLHNLFIDDLGFQLNGNFFNDLLFCVLQIGVVEEFAKLVPFLTFWMLHKKVVNEPIDIIAFFCSAALGFAAVENVLYFQSYGPQIIFARAILSTVTHMFCSAVVGYGFVQYIYRPGRNKVWVIAVFFFLAAASHGVYDFWLLWGPFQAIGYLVAIAYFFITISWFARILNNSLNISPFFSYQKVHSSAEVAGKLLIFYIVLLAIETALVGMAHGTQVALANMLKGTWLTLFIVGVTCFRMSKLTLIQGRWEPLKLELPFVIERNDPLGVAKPFVRIRIKGEPYSEAALNEYYNKDISIRPLNATDSHLGGPRNAYIEQKYYLKKDHTLFLIRIYESEDRSRFQHYAIQSKIEGKRYVNGHPVVALFSLHKEETVEELDISFDDLSFLDWAVVLPAE